MRLQPPRQFSAQLRQSRDARIDVKQLARQRRAQQLRRGGVPLPLFEPFHLFISSLLGSVVMVWSVPRLLDPQPRFGRYDAAARYLFSLWMAWALLVTGQPVLWLFIVPELAWGLAQSLPLRGAGGGREGRAHESLLR
ncbi:hypothetical protein [Janthinobacterium sp. PAMC25594]|uniref:hypothetical protein n=1 Tax=Janthinobacterium sp. PAMC25594 TaxID=2861284 RepID=UPI001C6396EE|nr:hypothetical protein [Janthinobacterium sp. PAMC25594]QYG06834.1 hypothetical protein KY494_27015 [Janthinobacterium sp. PAMC25594]